jgi:hypothetical protein
MVVIGEWHLRASRHRETSSEAVCNTRLKSIEHQHRDIFVSMKAIPGYTDNKKAVPCSSVRNRQGAGNYERNS